MEKTEWKDIAVVPWELIDMPRCDFARNFCTRDGADCFFPTNNPPFPLTKCARASGASIDPRLISKSTEEKSSKEESGRGSSGEPATVLTRQSGNWMQWDGTKKACATSAMTEGTGRAAARLAALYQTGILSRCDLDADPDL
jgi:hypothetical protein